MITIMQFLRVTFRAEIVSISILTEGDAGSFFHNLVFTALFNLVAHVNLHVFYFN
jgi:hypothetical protein